jgi:hypothetical protein
MKISELRKALKEKQKEELINEICILFKKFNNVQEYFQVNVQNDDSEILKKCKNIIKEEFYPKSEYKDPPMRLSVAKKAVSEFTNISDSKVNASDLMIFYVEIGVKFTLEYGDIDEPFYDSMESMYERALKYIVKFKVQEEFNKRLKAIVDDTEGMGWGFHDSLKYLYYKYIGKQS